MANPAMDAPPKSLRLMRSIMGRDSSQWTGLLTTDHGPRTTDYGPGTVIQQIPPAPDGVADPFQTRGRAGFVPPGDRACRS